VRRFQVKAMFFVQPNEREPIRFDSELVEQVPAREC
jgi:hypothetical protein